MSKGSTQVPHAVRAARGQLRLFGYLAGHDAENLLEIERQLFHPPRIRVLAWGLRVLREQIDSGRFKVKTGIRRRVT